MLAYSLGVFSMLAITVTATEGNLLKHVNFKKCFKANTVLTLYNLSFDKCSLECEERRQCAAVNYWRQRKKCELVDSTDTTPLQLTEVGDSCVSIAKSDLSEVDSCRECENETSCNATGNQCNKTECQRLTVDNGIAKGNMQHVGARQHVICDEHFKLEPVNASPVCEANGSWTVLPKCVPEIQCQQLTVDHGTVRRNKRNVGAKPRIICDEQFKLEPVNARPVCEANGSWTVLPKCMPEPNCKNYLVSGPNPVHYSQLTESDYACKCRICNPSDRYSAKYARLDMTGSKTGGWFSNSVNYDEYVQVDFHNVRTISAIALQGYSRYIYVTSFQVETSNDCNSFTTITDDTGNDKRFKGNTQRFDDIVIRDLLGTVKARCVRIIPKVWQRYQGLRFDVLGC